MSSPHGFDEAFERVKELAAIFKQNEQRYQSAGYSEAQARKDFIDKFWMALEWDVDHDTQTDPYKQEVKVERGVAVSEMRKRADYAFLAANFRDVRVPTDRDPWTVMAVMQSKLFLFLYRTSNQGESRVIPQVKASKLETLPFPDCNSSHPFSLRLNNLAAQMLEAKRQLAAARTERDRAFYESKCTTLDRQIDELVYQLYDLTPEETAIVGASGK